MTTTSHHSASIRARAKQTPEGPKTKGFFLKGIIIEEFFPIF